MINTKPMTIHFICKLHMPFLAAVHCEAHFYRIIEKMYRIIDISGNYHSFIKKTVFGSLNSFNEHPILALGFIIESLRGV